MTTIFTQFWKTKACLTSITPQITIPEFITIDNWDAAGSIFTDSNHMLAGYQPNKSFPYICGIGGSSNTSESYMTTILRETIEELLNIDEVPTGLIQTIETTIPPQKIVQNGTYIIAMYSFEDLEKMLRKIKAYPLKSNLYKTIPTTLTELILKRNVNHPSKPEISHLALIPVINYKSTNIISKYLIDDMKFII